MSSIPGPTSVCVAFFLVIVRSWWSFLFLQNKLTLAGENPRCKDEQMVEHLDGWRKGELKMVLLLTVCVCVHVWLASRCRGNSTVDLHDREKPECLCYTDTSETLSIKTIKTRVLFFLASRRRIPVSERFDNKLTHLRYRNRFTSLVCVCVIV